MGAENINTSATRRARFAAERFVAYADQITRDSPFLDQGLERSLTPSGRPLAARDLSKTNFDSAAGDFGSAGGSTTLNAGSYDHLGNPLFIPETRGRENAGANALFAFGQGAFGFSPFAIDGSNNNKPLALAYDTLNQLAQLLTSADRSQMSSVVRQAGDSQTAVELGGCLLRVKYQEGTHASGPLQQECPNVPLGAAIIISTALDEFLIAGEGLSVTFLPSRLRWTCAC